MHRRLFIFLIAILLMVGFGSSTSSAAELMQLSGVIHVHSTYSSGKYSIGELVGRAKDKQLDVLILTDHDQVVMEYGIFPLRNLVKRREERPSVMLAGVEKYLSEIKRWNRRQQSVLVVPGIQSSPFYYWTGTIFGRGLTAHDFRKELLIVGMSNPDDYHNLPLLHGPLSVRYVKYLLPGFLIFLAAFLLSIFLIFQKGKWGACGILIAVFSLAMLIDRHPFKSSRFDPYHADQGVAPFQETIDYARSRGGLVFWAHPESKYSQNGVQLGPVKLMTAPYPEALIESKNYTGFAALYGDSITATNPGNHWDRVLLQYCRGERAEPVWGMAGSDFHEEQKGHDLDTFQTVFLVENRRPQDVLQALERGRIYAVRKAADFRLALDRFLVKDGESGRHAIAGEELNSDQAPVVEGRLSASGGGRFPLSVSIIRGGKPVWSFEGQTPLKFELVDHEKWSGKTYYRLEARGNAGGRLLSNPIFVVRK